jgi:hypothetical protein
MAQGPYGDRAIDMRRLIEAFHSLNKAIDRSHLPNSVVRLMDRVARIVSKIEKREREKRGAAI